MKNLRRGREFYGSKYEEAMRLHGEGLTVKEIASKLGISYSAAYHWVRGIRKPEAGNVNIFVGHLQKNGPTAAIDIKERFAKHNELFLIATRRGLPVRRQMLQKRLGEYSVWYYLAGQEKELEKKINMLMDTIKRVKERLRGT